MIFILKQKEFLQFKLGKSIIYNWQQQLDATTLNDNSVEECEEVCEELMFLAQRVAIKNNKCNVPGICHEYIDNMRLHC